MRAGRIICITVVCYVVISAILAICLGELAFRPQRVPITRRKQAEGVAAQFGGQLQDVSVTATDGIHLEGWFARPANANGDAVILFHGVGDNRQGMMGFAELFLSNGFAVLVPDSRAQGESGGYFPTYGIKERDDVHQWFDWLAVQQHPRCVFGMGESMGAAILLQSIEGERGFCAVVAESSFASFRQIAYVRVGQLFHTGDWLGKVALRPAVELAFLYGRVTRGVNLADASPQMSVIGRHVPILLIHGQADENIPPRQSEWIREHNPAEIVLWEVPNAGHCGAASAAGQGFDTRVLRWFGSHDSGGSTVPTPVPTSMLAPSPRVYERASARPPETGGERSPKAKPLR
jgi:dipeptidyl aminopeptidase/acylaminoacyl peptidase